MVENTDLSRTWSRMFVVALVVAAFALPLAGGAEEPAAAPPSNTTERQDQGVEKEIAGKDKARKKRNKRWRKALKLKRKLRKEGKAAAG